MPVRGDRDILLPQEDRRLHLVSRLRAILRWPSRLPKRASAGPAPATTDPADLWAGFEYLVGEYESTGSLREDLADALAASMAQQSGQSRFDVQCQLAGVLNDCRTVRFHGALRLATQMPVPQARTALLEMLTQPDLASWQPAPSSASRGNAQGRQCCKGHDLRPAVIASLGQLRDPSLLGLFHRLLEKLSSKPIEHRKLIAAVQWSLMNLAPGGSSESVPASILSVQVAAATDPTEQADKPGNGKPLDRTSSAEALRVVALAQGRSNASPAPSNGNGTSSSPAGTPSIRPQDPPGGTSERNDLLSGF